MTDEMIREHPWEDLEELVGAEDVGAITEFLQALPPEDVSRTVSRLPEETQSQLLTTLEPDKAAELIETLPEVQAVDLLEHVEPATAAAILHELPSNTQADLIGEIREKGAEAILAAMDPEEAADARTLIAYAEDVAGGLMITEYLAYPHAFTVSQVIEDLRSHADEYADYNVQYVYVVDDQERLVGVLRLRDLLLSRQGRRIDELMILEPERVSHQAPLDELEVFFDTNHLFGAPVVDDAGRLVGVVERSAVERALSERNVGEYRRSLGIVGGEELRTMPVWLRARRRLSWLSVNIVLNVIAASVIAFYTETLEAVIALAVFLPIISDMSGCSGNQAVAVSMREISLGLVRPADAVRVWLKEVAVGLINGIALGILIAAVAWLWKGNPWLGGVVGVALMLNTLVAVSIGGTVPLLLKGLKMDPALASGPILTTVTDMCGFFLVLTFAALMLARLT